MSAGLASARRSGSQWVLKAYLAVFFLYLFLPLIIMVVAAFNANSNPSIVPWNGFTLDWFTGRYAEDGTLLVRGLPQESRFLVGLWHSILIAAGRARARCHLPRSAR
jgi:spermidine/putrescine transport system permease protein